MAAEITHRADAESGHLGIVLEGTISKVDAHKVEQLMSAYPGRTVGLWLDSSGGSVDAALALGRAIRRRDASVSAGGQCLSSCVLLYAAGVQRSNISQRARAYNEPSGVGIHRIYFSHVHPNATTEQIAKLRENEKTKIRSYLQEMSVSLQLIDAMESVPPESMRILTGRELREFGLGALDPAYEEKLTAIAASEYKISSLEYRKRMAAAKVHCTQPAVTATRSSARGLPDLDFSTPPTETCESKFIRTGGK